MARKKLTTKEANALAKLVNKAQEMYTVANLELPRDFRLLTTRPRAFSRAFSFGKTFGLLVLISRAYNRPQNKEERFDFDLQLDNNELQLEVLGNIDPELLEEVRESNGYHSFVIKDEHDIAQEIHDPLEPDFEMAIEASTAILKHLKLDVLVDVLTNEAESFSQTAWDKAEDKALAKAKDELAEAKEVRDNMKSLEEEV